MITLDYVSLSFLEDMLLFVINFVQYKKSVYDFPEVMLNIKEQGKMPGFKADFLKIY